MYANESICKFFSTYMYMFIMRVCMKIRASGHYAICAAEMLAKDFLKTRAPTKLSSCSSCM